MKGNSDRNASLVIGQRLVTRYQKSSQEKPPTPLKAGRVSKDTGVVISQDAGHPPEAQGMEIITSMAPLRIDSSGWMSIYQIFLTNYGFHLSRSHATRTPKTDYVGVSEAAVALARAECHS